jgi:hypothetical protein
MVQPRPVHNDAEFKRGRGGKLLLRVRITA